MCLGHMLGVCIAVEPCNSSGRTWFLILTLVLLHLPPSLPAAPPATLCPSTTPSLPQSAHPAGEPPREGCRPCRSRTRAPPARASRGPATRPSAGQPAPRTHAAATNNPTTTSAAAAHRGHPCACCRRPNACSHIHSYNYNHDDDAARCTRARAGAHHGTCTAHHNDNNHRRQPLPAPHCRCHRRACSCARAHNIAATPCRGAVCTPRRPLRTR